MCGIWLAAGLQQDTGRQLLQAFVQPLLARGPDQLRAQGMDASGGLRLLWAASLLQLRGTAPSGNPQADVGGNLLAFNGEVFGGVEVAPGANDAAALLHKLQQEPAEGIPALMSRVEGPWSLLYWRSEEQTLWFGRDVLGRRSLLIHLPTLALPLLLLTSVGPDACCPRQGSHGSSVGSSSGACSTDALHLQELPPGLYSIQAAALAAALREALPVTPAADGVPGAPCAGPPQPLEAGCACVPHGTQQQQPPMPPPPPQQQQQQQQQQQGEACQQGGWDPRGGCVLPHFVRRCPWQQQRLLDIQRYVRREAGSPPVAPLEPSAAGATHVRRDAAADAAHQQPAAGQAGEDTARHALDAHAAVVAAAPAIATGPHESQLQQVAQQMLDVLQQAVAVRCHALDHAADRGSGSSRGSSSSSSSVAGAGAQLPAAASSAETQLAGWQASAGRWYLLHHRPDDAPVAPPPAAPPAAARPGTWRHPLPPSAAPSCAAPPSLLPHQPLLPPATVLVLFSGGVDSTLLAAMAHRALPRGEPIDLVNVCFDHGKSPDRLAALDAVEELAAYAPDRLWRLILVDSTLDEVDLLAPHLQALLAPAGTIMDINIGAPLWLAARAAGRHVVCRGGGAAAAGGGQHSTPARQVAGTQQHVSAAAAGTRPSGHEAAAAADAPATTTASAAAAAAAAAAGSAVPGAAARPAAQSAAAALGGPGGPGAAGRQGPCFAPPEAAVVCSAAPVALLGHGADEQCGGYGRHRTAFRERGVQGLASELQLDMSRLWLRNLGRDDRLVSSLGREARHPFLAEPWVERVRQLPLHLVVDLRQPPGTGDKRLLRCMLRLLGLPRAAARVKRAIQFGSRLGQLTNVRDFGSGRAANKQSAGSLSLRQLRAEAGRALDGGGATGGLLRHGTREGGGC